MMTTFTHGDVSNTFSTGELVTWHTHNGSEKLPVPAVVLGQESNIVTIQARMQGKVQQITVPSDQLTSR